MVFQVVIYGCESWTIRKLSTEELMLLNCGVNEDSWKSLIQQGDRTSPSERKSVLNIHWKDWCCSLSSNTLPTWCEELTHWKSPWCWKDWRQEEEGMAENEMVGWHQGLNGHEFEQAPGDGEGQGSLACCSPWSRRVEHNWTTKQQTLITSNSKIAWCVWNRQPHLTQTRFLTPLLRLSSWTTLNFLNLF